MKVFNNNGQLAGEINSGVAANGDRFTTNTQYDDRGNPVFQHISVKRSDGSVIETDIFGSKILP